MLVQPGAGQIIGVVVPCLRSGSIAAVEDRRRIALCHLRLKRGVILTGRSCQDIDLNAVFICVSCRKILPLLIDLRLEVQIVNLAGTRIKAAVFGFIRHYSPCHHGRCQNGTHRDTENLLHVLNPLSFKNTYYCTRL